MAKVFVICGHGAGDSGAVGGGYTEADLVRRLASRMRALGGSAVQVGDTSRNWYAEALISKGMCPKGVPVVELHMDSAAAGARGGHVIIRKGLEADAYDRALESFIKGFFPGRSVTLSERSDLANPNRAKAMGVNYRLVECGFISDYHDRAKFINQMDDLARGILSAFGIKSGQTAQTGGGSASQGVSVAYTVRITADSLNVRKGPGTSYTVVGTVAKGNVFTIVEEHPGTGASKWGRLKSGAGWISLDHAERHAIAAVAKGVHRLYNPYSGDHLLTPDVVEARAMTGEGWTYEGVAFREGDGEPVERLYNPHTGEHLYTKDVEEHNALVDAGWVCEGEAFREGTKETVRRLYNPRSDGAAHHYTADVAEAMALVDAGWVDEGAAFVVD